MNTKGYDSTMIDWEYERLRCKDYEKLPGDPMTEPKERASRKAAGQLKRHARVEAMSAQLTALRALLHEMEKVDTSNGRVSWWALQLRAILDGKTK